MGGFDVTEVDGSILATDKKTNARRAAR